MLKGIAHVGLTVSDVNNSINFYQNVLGLKYVGQMIMEGTATEKLFNRKDCRVKVAYLNGSNELAAPPVELIQFDSEKSKTAKSKLTQTSISELCFYVKNIEETYNALKSKGVEFLSEPQYFDLTSQGFGKSKAVYFKDPDGIILELMEPIE